MGRPGRVSRNDDGQWVSMAQASHGGRRVAQDRDVARDMCVNCGMGAQKSEWKPEVCWLGRGSPGNYQVAWPPEGA